MKCLPAVLLVLTIVASAHCAERPPITIVEKTGRVTLTAAADDRTLNKIPDNTRILFMLSSQKITPEGFKQLARLHNLEFIRINGTTHGDAVLAALADHPTLNKLMMANDTGITSNGLRQLATAKLLRSLDISDVPLDQAALESLPANLERLAINRCRVGDAGVSALPNFPKLKSISLKYDDQITNAGLIGFIKRHPQLEGIAVDETSSHFLNSLAELPQLKTLFLSDSPTTESGWQAIGRLESLEEMWVSSELTDVLRAYVRQLPNPKLDHVTFRGKYVYLDRRQASQ